MKETNLGTLMEYAGRRRVLTYLSWILSAVSALLALVPFVYIWAIIDEVLAVAPDYAAAAHATEWGWAAVWYGIASALVYVAALMCSHISAFRIASNMQKSLLQRISELPLGTVEKFGSGKLRRIVTESTKATETYLAHRLPDKAGAIATPAGLLVLLFVFDWRLGILSLVPVILAFVIMTRMTGKRMEESMKQYQDALGDMSAEAVEYVRGVPVLKTFGQTIFSLRRFRDSINSYEKWVIAYTKELRLPMVIYTMIINSVFAFLIAGGAILGAGGVSSELLTNLIFYVIVTPIIGTTLTKIMFMSEDSMIVQDALSRTNAVLSSGSLEQMQPSAVPSDSTVELDHVTFSYDDRKNALEDVSIVIRPGSQTALVGASGSGKTTAAELTARCFDPQSGSVRIGGTDVRRIPRKTLMDMISFVSQDSHLLKTSILENVRLGRPDATRDQVMEALRKAQCMDIIDKLPDGIDTVVGTDGTHLSGGEQQRIAIARAFLKDAPILILDEATAFADPDNEMRIRNVLRDLKKDKTVLLIAHRLTTVADADEVCVLKDGRIAETGSPSALLAGTGLFRKMWDEYLRDTTWKEGDAA